MQVDLHIGSICISPDPFLNFTLVSVRVRPSTQKHKYLPESWFSSSSRDLRKEHARIRPHLLQRDKLESENLLSLLK